MVGDYRRVFAYLLPIFYYLSPLHSILAHIHLREYLASLDDETTHPDSIPLSPHQSQWEAHGERSTIHIDPSRGKETPLSRDRRGAGSEKPVRHDMRDWQKD
jgi:hypothetical protein